MQSSLLNLVVLVISCLVKESRITVRLYLRFTRAGYEGRRLWASETPAGVSKFILFTSIRCTNWLVTAQSMNAMCPIFSIRCQSVSCLKLVAEWGLKNIKMTGSLSQVLPTGTNFKYSSTENECNANSKMKILNPISLSFSLSNWSVSVNCYSNLMIKWPLHLEASNWGMEPWSVTYFRSSFLDVISCLST